MGTITLNNSPIHGTSTIGQPFGNRSSSYSCGFHTGIDFPASGTDSFDIYSVIEGKVVYVYKDSQGTTPALGNQVQILGNDGRYYRFCHLLYGSITVNVNDNVSTLTKIGVMGNTGNSTGRHLHLECSNIQSWSCSHFLNPRRNFRIWKRTWNSFNL